MQKCSKCQELKSTSNFHKGSNNGYSSYCKPCASEYNKKKIKRKFKRVKSNYNKMECRTCETVKLKSEYPKGRYSCRQCCSHSSFVRNIEKKYNIPYSRYEQIKKEQKDSCAICSKKEKLLIDHDHSCCPGVGSCGRCVRGLVCFKCNVALGMVSDNKNILNSMILYLANIQGI